MKKVICAVADFRLSCVAYPKPEGRVSDLISPEVSLVVLVHEKDHESALIRQFLHECGNSSGPPVIIACERDQSSGLMEWIQLGAADSISLPTDLNRLGLLVDSLTMRARLDDGHAGWLTAPGLPRFCVDSHTMRRFSERIATVAEHDENVLITGETGTGKSHIAQLIHANSRRSSEPIALVNCAAIPETLIESELFGHASGAFTGADRDNEGVFTSVGTGTLFLDEIDALPLSSQPKLLHAVDHCEFSPVGTHRSQKFRGRLITATNQDLRQLRTENRFRSDLFYRLSVLELCIPPLRERRTDIKLLAEEFIEQQQKRTGCGPRSLSTNALAALEAYHWPGNVRELHNAIASAMTFGMGDCIELEDIPHWVFSGNSVQPSNAGGDQMTDFVASLGGPGPLEACSLRDARNHGESAELARQLKANSNNRAKTARALGISRSALYKRMRKLGFYGT